MSMLSRFLTCTILPAILFACQPGPAPEVPPMSVTPSPEQVSYQQQELVGFVHFTINTFTNKEWGYGDESPALFDPTELDAEQWARTAKAAGLKELILTAKHHDGFCLWPSAYTEHSVRNSPYRDGKGDVVREFVDACRKHGLKVGLYLSPWDRNHPDYGRPEYITYYRNQLRELLTNYGEISEIWFDGANGGDGYYGGANETRRIDRKTYYDWPNTFALVKELQPGIQIFSDAGPDIRWVGNEHGFAGETFWSTIAKDSLVIGGSNPAYLNTGSPEGDIWLVGQCDVSIRPGWFYHPDQDSLVKSPEKLMEIYLKSVGRNGVLLLNLPPDRRGLIHEADVASLQAWTRERERRFADNLAVGAAAEASSTFAAHPAYAPAQVVDGAASTYWAAEADTAWLELKLPQVQEIHDVVLQEYIPLGQRVQAFTVEALMEDRWQVVSRGTTVGYKRILPLENISTDRLRIRIEAALAAPVLAEVALYGGN